MKKVTLFISALTLIFLTSFSFCHAQEEESTYGSNQALMDGSGAFISTIDLKNKKAIGSPYLYKDFTVAKISATPSEIYNIRYNAYTDEIEVKVEEDKVQNFNKNISNVVITFLNDNLKFTPLNYIDVKNGLIRGYFISLTETNQKVKLFSKKQVKYFDAKPARTSYDVDKPAEFKNMSDTYFVSIKGAYARELPSNKKDIAELFPENSKDVLEFIKKNKIKTSREADLIQLINYVNSL